jgi:signal transduction histidine kinase
VQVRKLQLLQHFINLGVITVRITKSLENAEVIAISLLALRIIPNILKGNFDDYSAGWWAAEIILLAGSIIGPAIFGALYLRSTTRAEREKRKATLYSDLLVHDITNYHQAIQMTLDLLEYKQMSDSMKKQAIEDAVLSLRRADHLVRNVRNLGKSEAIEETLIEPVELITCIKQAFNEALLVSSSEQAEFNIDVSESQCFVMANTLLVDVFLNLFRNAIQYSPNEKRIDIEVEKRIQDNKTWWQTRVIDYGQGIPPEKKNTLFQRYMQGASGTGLGLSVVSSLIESYDGSIHVEDRIPGDYSKGTVFVVNLHAVN